MGKKAKGMKDGAPTAAGSVSAKGTAAKTNVARLLDHAGIPYRLVPYEFDPEDLAATHVAEELGEDIAQVFKTLILTGEPSGPRGQGAGARRDTHFVCVIPGDKEVDLKKAARAASMKSAAMLPMKELLPLTGYIRGGCSPIGMKKPFPTFFHSTATEFDTIFVSAGVRGLQLAISPNDLIGFVGATITDLIKE